MPTRGKISEFFDFDNLIAEKQKASDAIAEFIQQVNKGANIKIKLSTSEKSGDIAKGFNELTASAQKAAQSGQQVVESQKKISDQVKQTQLELAEARKKSVEATTALKEYTLEQKRSKDELVKRSAAEKQAAAEAVAAGQERIVQLRAEQEAQEKLLQQVESRNEAEKQALSGTFNPGGGKKLPAVDNTPFIPQGSSQLQAAELVRIQGALKSLNADIANNEKLFKAGKISAAEYDRNIVTSTESILKYKSDLATLNKEIAQNGKIVTSEPYKQLSAAYNEAALKAKNLATELGVGHPKAVAAAADAKKLSDELKKIDNSVGQNQRNVGNYGEAISGAFGKAFSAIRQVANFLPGIGLSGIVLGIFTGITKAIEYFSELFKTIDTGRARVEALNDVNRRAVDIFNNQKSTAEALTAVVKDNNLSLGERKAALQQLIDISPEYLKGLTLENITTDEGKKILDGYIGSLQKKAELQAAEAVNADANKTVSNLKAERQALENMGKAGKVAFNDLSEAQLKYFDNSTSVGRIAFTASLLNLEVSKSDIAEALKNLDADIKKASVKVTASTDVYKQKFTENFAATGAAAAKGLIQNLKDQIAVLDKDLPTLLSEDLIKKNIAARKKLQDELDKLEGKEKKGPKQRESTKAILDSDFELYKIAQTERIKLLDDDVKNDKLSFARRIEALKEYSAEKQELVINQAIHDLQVQNDLDKVLAANEKKARGSELENIKIQRANIVTKKKEILLNEAVAERAIEKENADVASAFADRESADILARRKKHFDNEIKLIEDYFNEQKTARDNKYSDDTSALQRSFDQGEISQRRFNSKRLKLDFDYARDSLLIAIDAAEKKIQLFDISDEDRAKALAELAQLEKKLSDTSLNYFIKNEKQKREAILDTLSQVKDMGDRVFSVIDDLFEASAVKQKNLLDAQQKAAEDKAQKDIEAINASTRSEQDKAAAIIIINARVAAQKEQIARKEKAAELERAKFAKAAAIFNIILNTAQAVIKQQATTPLPWGAPFIAAVIALGAFELATAAARPIPKYKYGTGNAKHPGGAALVGDGFKKEMTITPEGQIGITPAVPTYLNLPKGTTVFPDADKMMRALMLHDMRQKLGILSKSGAGSNDFPLDHFDKTMRIHGSQIVSGISSAIKNQPRVILKGRTGYDIIFKNGNSETEYLNKNLQ